MRVQGTSSSDWLGRVGDDVLICDVNLPGTHDSASINKAVHTFHSCHHTTIREQLRGGVRLFDVRLEVRHDLHRYFFYTCHGSVGNNQFQSFDSLLDEFSRFLKENPSEFLVVSLKIDDWAHHRHAKADVLRALSETVRRRLPAVGSAHIPTVGEIRGKAFMINRIDDALPVDIFGVHQTWDDSTPGMYAHSAAPCFPFYVQDRYRDLPLLDRRSAKLKDIAAAINHQRPGEVVFNFCSARAFLIWDVYNTGRLLDALGRADLRRRPRALGWLLFDYEFTKYRTKPYGVMHVVDLVIDSNFGYSRYPDTFKVIGGFASAVGRCDCTVGRAATALVRG